MQCDFLVSFFKLYFVVNIRDFRSFFVPFTLNNHSQDFLKIHLKIIYTPFIRS